MTHDLRINVTWDCTEGRGGRIVQRGEGVGLFRGARG